jgi:hypothetical protein
MPRHIAHVVDTGVITMFEGLGSMMGFIPLIVLLVIIAFIIHELRKMFGK